MATRRKTATAIAMLLVALLATWFYFTPYIAVHNMRKAAEAKDAVKLADYVNFPALRESLKASFNAKFVGEMAKAKSDDRDNPFMPLVTMLTTVMIGQMVDAFITPEAIAAMMKGEEPTLKPKPGSAPAATTAPSAPSTPAAAAKEDLEVSMNYETIDRFVMTTKATKADKTVVIAFVFTRDGLASWKLSAVRLPL